MAELQILAVWSLEAVSTEAPSGEKTAVGKKTDDGGATNVVERRCRAYLPKMVGERRWDKSG